MMGIISLVITFFFAFIGTFLSRLFLSKESIGKAIVPTVIHFIITVFALIPLLGWFIYVIGTAYYMYQNYISVINK